MSSENPSILSHVSIGTNDLGLALKFYDAVLTPLGCTRQFELPNGVAYGKQFPEFWVQEPHNKKPASLGNGIHFGFIAPSKDAVQAFYDAALANGGLDDGAPGPRPDYGAAYFGCFVYDLDGHKIEASFWDESLQTDKDA